MKFRLRKIFGLGLLACFLVALPVIGLAAQKQGAVYVGADEILEGNFIKVADLVDIAGTVNGDVVVAGNSVTISGIVNGDVFAAGSIVNISGQVNGGVFAAGSTVQVGGQVNGSVHAAGSTVSLSGSVGHNAWLAGSTITVERDARIGWDIFSTGAAVVVQGAVEGGVWTTAADVVVNGSVGKDVTVKLGQGGHLLFSPEADITGNVVYTAAGQDQLSLSEGATINGEVRHQAFQAAGSEFGDRLSAAFFFLKILSLFSLLAIGLILIGLVPKKMLEIQHEMVSRPWQSLGRGLVILLLTPLLVLLIMVTLIGIPLGLIMLALYLVSLYVSKVIVGFGIGLWILNRLNAEKKFTGNLLWPLVVGLILYVIITQLPLVGWIFGLLGMIWALGAAFVVKRETLRGLR